MECSMFVLAVVPYEGRYLVIEERDGTWYLPAGRVEPGENLVAAVVRETIEEAKQLVGVLGVLAIDHDLGPHRTRMPSSVASLPPRGPACTRCQGSARMRFVFVCYRGVLLPTKNEADHHSRGADYKTREEIAKLPLRHPEVLTLIDAYESGRALMPTGAYDCRP